MSINYTCENSSCGQCCSEDCICACHKKKKEKEQFAIETVLLIAGVGFIATASQYPSRPFINALFSTLGVGCLVGYKLYEFKVR